MTHRTKGSVQKQPYPFVEISQEDADGVGVEDEEMVRIATKRGHITLRANITNRVMPNQIWIPFHFVSAQANLLTIDSCNATHSKGNSSFMPEYKICAARVEKLQ
jgi:predicted molibdopterin-dependent oxidoreductase YjgC